MEQHIKRMVVIQAMLITSIGVFANSRTGISDTSINKYSFSSKAILTERLVSFNATYSRNTVALHWNINAVNYANHFDIERSVDGVSFEKVGEAKLNNAAANEYSFEDNFKYSLTRNNDLFYRLKQTDADNKTAYSKVLIVRSFNSKSVKAISVTPDPSVNDIGVNVELNQNSFVVMKVVSSQGKEIMRKSVSAEMGDNKYSLEGTSKLLAGDYTLEIIVNSNERMTLKLIKS
jgi:hypothetical protein